MMVWVESLFTYISIRFILFIVPFKFLSPWITTLFKRPLQVSKPHFNNEPPIITEISATLSKLGQTHVFFDHCLSQSLTGHLMLSRRGYRSDLKVGVKKNSKDGREGFLAHAWLTFNDRVIIGQEEDPFLHSSFYFHQQSEAQNRMYVLSNLLRGVRPKLSSPGNQDNIVFQHLFEASEEQGVSALLCAKIDSQFKNKLLADGWPETFFEALQKSARLAAAQEMVYEQKIVQVLSRLELENIPVVLLKGTPLAYTLYPSPHNRSRQDTDLLIPERCLIQARKSFQELGYKEQDNSGNDHLNSQILFYASDKPSHDFDVHWNISNRKSFSEVLPFEELYLNSTVVSNLSPHARCPSHRHALFHACIHAGMHHYGHERLIWYYDMHLLLTAMSSLELQEFSELARTKKTCALVLKQILRCRDLLKTEFPDELVQSWLQISNEDKTRAVFAHSNLSWTQVIALDFKSSQGLSKKILFIKSLVLPPPSFMWSKYQIKGRHLAYSILPFLYAHRLWTGLIKIQRTKQF